MKCLNTLLVYVICSIPLTSLSAYAVEAHVDIQMKIMDWGKANNKTHIYLEDTPIVMELTIKLLPDTYLDSDRSSHVQLPPMTIEIFNSQGKYIFSAMPITDFRSIRSFSPKQNEWGKMNVFFYNKRLLPGKYKLIPKGMPWSSPNFIKFSQEEIQIEIIKAKSKKDKFTRVWQRALYFDRIHDYPKAEADLLEALKYDNGYRVTSFAVELYSKIDPQKAFMYLKESGRVGNEAAIKQRQDYNRSTKKDPKVKEGFFPMKFSPGFHYDFEQLAIRNGYATNKKEVEALFNDYQFNECIKQNAFVNNGKKEPPSTKQATSYLSLIVAATIGFISAMFIFFIKNRLGVTAVGTHL